MKAIFCGISIFFLALAYWMFVPEIVCTVEWMNSDLQPIAGPFHECNRSLDTRRIGFSEYTKIDNDVYRVSRIHGGALPSRALRPRLSTRIALVKFDVPVEWGKLKDYIGGRFLSDGKIILNLEGKQVFSLVPALDINNLRPVPNAALGSRRESDYMTDGRWVVVNNDIVKGAEAITFRQVYALELGGSQVEPQTQMQFGRDNNFIYHVDHRLENADPGSFGLISYNDCRNPPQGIQFSSDQVERGAGWVAVDKNQAWEVTFSGVTSLKVNKIELSTLQNDLKRANAASAIAFSGDFDESRCKR